MHQLFNEGELIGRKIKNAEEIGNYFFIFFDDKTYCVFHAPNTLNVETALMQEPYNPPHTGDIAKKMVQYGFYSQEEYDRSENALARLREAANREEAKDVERKKEEAEYKEKNNDLTTTCCGSKNHFLFQGHPYCHECNSACELE